MIAVKLTCIHLPGALTNPPVKWEPARWPETAVTHGLVLTGWGPDMPTLPTPDWADRVRGGLQHIHWQSLVANIPPSYHANPYYKKVKNELPLQFISLADFLQDHPGKCYTQSPSFSTYSIYLRACRPSSLCCRPHGGRPLFRWGV